jgi:hypothetical protein
VFDPRPIVAMARGPSVLTSCNNVVVTVWISRQPTYSADSANGSGAELARTPGVKRRRAHGSHLQEQFWSGSNERRHLRMITAYQVSF